MTDLTLKVGPLVAKGVSRAGVRADRQRSGTVRDASYSGLPGDEVVPEGARGNGAGTMPEVDAVEKTVQMVLDLPEGRDWEWLPDCNILVLASRLDEAGRQRAISDLQATWRRQFIKAVPGRRECPDVA